MRKPSDLTPDLSVTSDIDLKEEAFKYLRFWPLFLLSLIIALAICFLYLRYTPNVYQTKAKIKVLSTEESAGIPELTRVSFFRRSDINLDNYVHFLTSYQLSEQVVKELGLTETIYKQGRIIDTEIFRPDFKLVSKLPLDSIATSRAFKMTIQANGLEFEDQGSGEQIRFDTWNTDQTGHELPFDVSMSEERANAEQGVSYLIRIDPVERIARQLQGRIRINSLGDNSDVLEISYTGQSKEKSEAIINTLIEIYNEDGKNDKRRVHQRTIRFIDNRFNTLIGELDTIEIDKQEFKQQNQFIDIAANSAVQLEQDNEINQALFQIENQISLAELLVETLRDGSETDLLPANIGISDISINAEIDRYNQVVLERDKFTTAGGENNPSVRLLNNTISDIRGNLDKSLDAYIAQLKLTREQTLSLDNDLNRSLSSFPIKEKVLRDIERKQQIKEGLYLLLLEKRELAAISDAVTDDVVKVVDFAFTPGCPVSPKRRLIYAGGLVVGLLVPFAALYLMFMLDTKVHRKKDLEDVISDVVVVGEIPQISKSEDHVFSSPDQRTVVAECSRIISSNIDYLLPEKNPGIGQVILTTSTIKGEGKTFAAVNFSLAMASIKKKVLLIGADLRNPQLHNYINLEKNLPGLSNYLNDSTLNWKEFLIKGFEQFPTHDILIAGALPPNPVQLLSNGNLERLLEEAKSIYDYIVIDAAPTILVTDTLVIADIADATVYMCRANHTEKELLNWSKDLIKQQKLKNVGFVINGLGAGRRKGYAYKYSYNYGYRYGYGSS